MIGVDWRTPLDEAWDALGDDVAVQGNLDPLAALRAAGGLLERRANAVLATRGGRPGHIFNLGHGILPGDAGRQRATPRGPRAHLAPRDTVP